MLKKSVIAVAMSGGVDSSVAALLVKKQAKTAFGLFMRLGNPNENEAERAARAVCRRLSMELRVVNLADQFAVKVKKYYLDSYEQGVTPNPCAICNRLVKFGDLLRRALAAGADYLATGHYVRRREKKEGAGRASVFELWSAADQSKDQSYFLWGLTPAQIRPVLFPLGDLRKTLVRRLAKRAGLPSLEKESHDACFLSQSAGHQSFLRSSLRLRPGPIIAPDSKIIGQHEGLPLYTIGQRQGIAVGGAGPYYVYGKDRAANALLVAGPDRPDLFRKKSFIVGFVNWIKGARPRLPLSARIVFRYRHPGAQGLLKAVSGPGPDKKIIIELTVAQKAITPGQSAVFYRGRQLVGGGIILEND